MHAINSLVGTILVWAIGLFILYVVISTAVNAVSHGLNKVYFKTFKSFPTLF